MRIRLADPGDIRSPFGQRRDTRARSLRDTGGEGGGGTGEKESEETDEDEKEEKEEDEDEDEKDGKDDTELKKAIRRRDRVLREKRALERELKELRDKDTKKDEPDPVKLANTRLVRSEVRAQLASAGVTERDDQKEILEILNLDGVSVGDDGDVDVDEIEDRIAILRRVFGGSSKPTKRSPRVDTRDRSSDKDKNTDPDKDRYKRILGRG